MITTEKTSRMTAKCLFYKEKPVSDHKPHVGWTSGPMANGATGDFACVRVVHAGRVSYMTPTEADALAFQLKLQAEHARESIEAARNRGEIK